jgi:hypothetical protein
MEITITHNESEWLAVREGRFTASDIHKLMGAPRNKSEYLSETAKSFVYEKASELLTGIRKPIWGEALTWGTENEKEAFEVFQHNQDDFYTYYGGETYTFIPYGEYSGYSPDALGSNCLVEIKNPFNSGIHLKNRSIKCAEDLGKIHPEYYWQMQLGMIASAVEFGYFVSYDKRMPGTHNLFIAHIELEDVQEIIDEKLYYANELLQSIVKLM